MCRALSRCASVGYDDEDNDDDEEDMEEYYEMGMGRMNEACEGE